MFLMDDLFQWIHFDFEGQADKMATLKTPIIDIHCDCHRLQSMLLCYTMGCPPVHGDNPQALSIQRLSFMILELTFL